MRAVDLFAGWGGFTLGAEQAGIEVVLAANHWDLAVRAHALNHPSTEHRCQDLRQTDWTTLPEYEILLASPACQGHSTASQPRRRLYHDALRATAWAVVDCAEVTRPELLVVENVPAFKRWTLFPLWCEALRMLGYRLEIHTLNAAHYGVPQRRRRLFITGTRDGRKLHVPAGSKTETPFGPCIDWQAGTWRLVQDAPPKARERMTNAVAAHGPRCLSQHVTNHPGVPLDQAIRTITTADQWVAVDGDKYRPLTIRENARAMGFPEDYAWPVEANRGDCITGLGNAVCPEVARVICAAA